MIRHLHARRRLQADITAALRAGDWEQTLMLAGSGSRPTLLKRLWPRLNMTQKPLAMELAIANGELLRRQRPFLIKALTELKAAGIRVFDGDAARNAFAELPQHVRIYRGTVKAEGDSATSCGVCWTLRPEIAKWFAYEHDRFHAPKAPPPVIRSATIERDNICGLLFERDESEVLVCPADCIDIAEDDSQL